MTAGPRAEMDHRRRWLASATSLRPTRSIFGGGLIAFRHPVRIQRERPPSPRLRRAG